jgi:hypothetical protein
MKYLSIIILGLLLISFVFAGVTPSSLGLINMRGGEDKNFYLTIENEFNSSATVVLRALVSNESGDINGFFVLFNKNNFILGPKASTGVILNIKLVENIFPERYDVNIDANFITNMPQNIYDSVNISSGGGYTIRVIDNNVPVVVEVEKEVMKEVVRDNDVVYVDKNVVIIQTVEVPRDLELIDVVFFGLIGFVVAGVVIFIYFIFFYKKGV